MVKSVVSALIIFVLFSGSALAECQVDQGALCSPQKNNLVLLIMALERKDEVRVNQLVKGGRVKPCKKASAKVIRKEKMRNQGMLYADVAGVGKVWVREENVCCD
jgi:hypothetical protein